MLFSRPELPGDWRYEVKLVAIEAYLPRLLATLRTHPMAFQVLYPDRHVNNVYFDSQDLSRLNQNYAGVGDRCKLRYRWYGDALTGANGHFELKYKRLKLGGKHNFPASSPVDLETMPWSEFLSILRKSVTERAWAEVHNLARPVILNRYRRSYFSNAAGTVRVTVDREQRFLNQWNSVRPNLSFEGHRPQQLVVEVKADASNYDDVERTIASLGLHVSRNSKYVTGVELSCDLG